MKMTKIEEKAREFQTIEEINRELKRLSSAKCILKKHKYRPDYDKKMTEILQEEQIMKEVKQLLFPKKKFVTNFTQSDIDQLDYDETIKAIKSIQSKKFHTRWLTPTEGDNDEYRNAERIEQMLLKHKDNVKPIEETTVRKTDVNTIIETIETSGDLSKEAILELLKKLQ